MISKKESEINVYKLCDKLYDTEVTRLLDKYIDAFYSTGSAVKESQTFLTSQQVLQDADRKPPKHCSALSLHKLYRYI